MKTALVLGCTGFIGHHLARRLKSEGYWVRGIDIKPYEYGLNDFADDLILADLTNFTQFENAIKKDDVEFDEVYCLAAFMGGAGVVFSGDNDAKILRDNLLININTAEICKNYNIPKVFFSSSACCYNHLLQQTTDNKGLSENMAYPAFPDSDYGFEKLIAERIYQAYNRNYDIDIRIARFHNIFGPEGTWHGGKEKVPSALCRKIIRANLSIEVWGDGEQTRSFLYIDECIEGIRRLMTSDFQGPVNIGSEEMISINNLAKMIMKLSGKELKIEHKEGPLGVRGRTSDNKLIREQLGWEPKMPLVEGITKTYNWIKEQIENDIDFVKE
jgi:GDP-D-mannose 3', 5'-epimerase